MERILENFNNQINNLENTTDNVREKAEKGIKISKKSLLLLRKQMLNNPILTDAEEINFFKNIKPKIQSRLIYYVKLFRIESKLLRRKPKNQRKYLNNKIKSLDNYFKKNIRFHQYLQSKSTCSDCHYFLRCKDENCVHSNNFICFIDEKFSTPHDSIAAKLKANEWLMEYLQQKMNEVNIQSNQIIPAPQLPSFQIHSSLGWTANKVDLIELIYALQSSGAINNGRANLKEMATLFEQLFNVQLGDYYRSFVEIRARKDDNTKFIDSLKNTLQKRITDLEE